VDVDYLSDQRQGFRAAVPSTEEVVSLGGAPTICISSLTSEEEVLRRQLVNILFPLPEVALLRKSLGQINLEAVQHIKEIDRTQPLEKQTLLQLLSKKHLWAVVSARHKAGSVLFDFFLRLDADELFSRNLFPVRMWTDSAMLHNGDQKVNNVSMTERTTTAVRERIDRGHGSRTLANFLSKNEALRAQLPRESLVNLLRQTASATLFRAMAIQDEETFLELQEGKQDTE
ncbi:unnamed protein product, partial [Amoebophrya sp. A25]